MKNCIGFIFIGRGYRKMKGTAITLILFFVVIAGRLEARPITDDYGYLPFASFVTISPNGERVALREAVKFNSSVAVYSVQGARRGGFLSLEDTKLWNLSFVSDSRLVLMVAENTKIRGYKGEMDLSTAFSFNPYTGQLRQLIIPGRRLNKNLHIHPAQSGMGRVVGVTPDKHAVFIPAYIAKREGDNNPDLSLLEVPLEAESTPRIVVGGRPHTRDYFVNGRGEVVAQELYDERRNKHSVLVKREGAWETIYEQTTEMLRLSFEGMTPDYQALVLLARAEGEDRRSFYTLSLQDGMFRLMPFGREDADIERVITDINRVVYGIVYSGFTPSYRFFNENLDNRVREIVEAFPGQSVTLVDWTPNWESFIVQVAGSNSPGDYYLVRSDNEPHHLISARKNINAEDVHPLRIIQFPARDGRSIPTILTIPKEKQDELKKLPTVILPHGGPAIYDPISFDFMAQALANRGYLVVQPQFRGSAGFGYEHMAAGYGEWGKKMQDDITDAILYLTKEGYVDPKRVCIAGMSYGGYAALAGGAFTPELYKCIVSIAGIGNLDDLIKSDRGRYGKHHQILSYLKMSIGGGEMDRKFLREISPMFHADKFRAPVLLIHGKADKVVDYRQSKKMNSALKKAKKSVKLVELKDEDHYLSYSETRLITLQSMVDFIDQHIGHAGQH